MVQEKSKGKKRAHDETQAESSSSSLSPVPPEQPPVKKPKRAETRKCPVCDELIPLRLLATHSELELERVEEVIKGVGSTVVMLDEPDEDSSNRSRRSAVRARKSLSAMNPRANPADMLEQTNKVIQTIKRHRKQRHARLREMARDDEEGTTKVRDTWASGGGEIVCPVCLQIVRGDEDVREAHVDACLAHESRRLEEERERNVHHDLWEGVDGGGEPGIRIGNVSGARGTGFHVRDRNEQDVEDEVDVDGDDEAVFGDAQFTEGDILGPADDTHPVEGLDVEVEVEIEGDSDTETQKEQKTLRDLVAEGKVVRRRTPGEGVEAAKAKMEEVMGLGDADRMDLAVLAARKQGNASSLISALENKIKQLESMRVSSSTSLLCRICLDPYTEPTVSTGCWHTCCRECWLRCLGSTKLCPSCKRITAATDLRKIYL